MDTFLKSLENLKNIIHNLINYDDISVSNLQEINNGISNLIDSYNNLLFPITNYLNTNYKGIFISKLDELYFENISLFYNIINNLLVILNNIQEILKLQTSKLNYNYKKNLINLQKEKIKEIINQLDLIPTSLSILLLEFNELLTKDEEIYNKEANKEIETNNELTNNN